MQGKKNSHNFWGTVPQSFWGYLRGWCSWSHLHIIVDVQRKKILRNSEDLFLRSSEEPFLRTSQEPLLKSSWSHLHIIVDVQRKKILRNSEDPFLRSSEDGSSELLRNGSSEFLKNHYLKALRIQSSELLMIGGLQTVFFLYQKNSKKYLFDFWLLHTNDVFQPRTRPFCLDLDALGRILLK